MARMKHSQKMLIGWLIGSIAGIGSIYALMYYIESGVAGQWLVLGPIMALIMLLILLRQQRKQPPQLH